MNWQQWLSQWDYWDDLELPDEVGRQAWDEGQFEAYRSLGHLSKLRAFGHWRILPHDSAGEMS